MIVQKRYVSRPQHFTGQCDGRSPNQLENLEILKLIEVKHLPPWLESELPHHFQQTSFGIYSIVRRVTALISNKVVFGFLNGYGPAGNSNACTLDLDEHVYL